MNALSWRAALLIFTCFVCSAQSPPSAPAMSVQQILARMDANTSGLQAYQVPVRIDARIRKVITLPVSMSGTRYFKRPDKEALKMSTVPAIAKPFENAYASLGTPNTWPKTYSITQTRPSVAFARPVYELRGTYKRSSNVDRIILDVDASTFDPVQARWYYKNGATIVMNIEEQLVDGKYRLPTHETLDVSFPAYRGNADVHYGDYVINQPIPDSVFAP